MSEHYSPSHKGKLNMKNATEIYYIKVLYYLIITNNIFEHFKMF